MKRYYWTIIFFIILFLVLSHYKKTEIPVFNEIEDYNNYEIELNKTILETREIFSNISELDYVVLSYEILNNYNEYIKNDINSIIIEPNSFIVSFREYLNEYNKILFKYNLDYNVGSNIIINKVFLKTTNDIYEQIKKAI